MVEGWVKFDGWRRRGGCGCEGARERRSNGRRLGRRDECQLSGAQDSMRRRQAAPLLESGRRRQIKAGCGGHLIVNAGNTQGQQRLEVPRPFKWPLIYYSYMNGIQCSVRSPATSFNT